MTEEQVHELLKKLGFVLREPTPPGLYDKIRDKIHMRIAQLGQLRERARPGTDVPETDIGPADDECGCKVQQELGATCQGESWPYADMQLASFEEKSSNRCGVSQTGGVVVFTASYPSAKEVLVAGSFNNWRPEATLMRRLGESGIWQARVRLREGVYEYRFIVDGQWQEDPCNRLKSANPYGGYNSLAKVGSHAERPVGVGSPQMASAGAV